MRMRFASFFTHDEDRAIDFWVNKIGLQLMLDNPTNFGSRFLAFAPPGGGTWLVLTKPVPGMPGEVGGFTNIAWDVEDLEATYEDWKAKGVEFPEPPARRFWGGIEARFKDPDGNIFMIQQGGF